MTAVCALMVLQLAPSAPFQFVECETQRVPCLVDETAVPPVELRTQLETARAFLESVGAWPQTAEALLVVTEAPIASSYYVDAGFLLGPSFTGRAAVVWGRTNGQPVWTDIDAVVHELVHHWLRSLGPPDQRITLDADGVARNDQGLLHEAIADFLTAAKSQRPTIARQATPAELEARSLAIAVSCPNELTGAPHDDSQAVSSALWALSGTEGVLQVARELVAAAAQSTSIDAFVNAMGRVASDPTSWALVVERHGLRRCHDAIALDAGARFSAHADRFVIAGTEAFDGGVSSVGSGQWFQVTLPEAGVQELTVSVQATRTLWLHWRSTNHSGAVPLVDGPRPWVKVAFDHPVHDFSFRLYHDWPTDSFYDNVVVVVSKEGQSPTPLFGLVMLLSVLSFVLWLIKWRPRVRA